MERPITILTERDKLILQSYVPIAEGIAEFWGENCEVIIHNLSRLDASVMKIINGDRSGRQEGAPISEVTLSIVNKMMADRSLNHVTYFAKNKRGEPFKASTSAIIGERGNIIGLFCINYYLSASLFSIIQTFTPALKNENDSISETFVDNTEELMLNALEEAKKVVYDNFSIPSANKNKEIVSILYQKGIFNLKDSVGIIADNLGISKNTVYMHLRNMK